jgi:hypothetical protein
VSDIAMSMKSPFEALIVRFPPCGIASTEFCIRLMNACLSKYYLVIFEHARN